jgi:CheY-like chemotaxis protein
MNGNGKMGRLLLVEDSIDLQEVTRELFELEGYEVYCSGNGEEALVFLRCAGLKPDLILLDLMMPVMDGFLADPAIATIPVVVITADSNGKAKAAEMRANDFCNKTGGVENLLSTVRKNCIHNS